MAHSSRPFIRPEERNFRSNAKHGRHGNEHKIERAEAYNVMQRNSQDHQHSEGFAERLPSRQGNEKQSYNEGRHMLQVSTPNGYSQQRQQGDGIGESFQIQSRQGNEKQSYNEGRHMLQVSTPNGYSQQRQQQRDGIGESLHIQSRQGNEKQSYNEGRHMLQMPTPNGYSQQRQQQRDGIGESFQTQSRQENERQSYNEGRRMLQMPTPNGYNQQRQQHGDGIGEPLGNEQHRHHHKQGHRAYRTHQAHHRSHHSSHASGHSAKCSNGFVEKNSSNDGKSYEIKQSQVKIPGSDNKVANKSKIAPSTAAPKPVQNITLKKPSVASAIASLNTSLVAPVNPEAASANQSPKTEHRKAPGGYPGGGYPGQPAPGGFPGGFGQPGYGAGDPLYGYFSAVAGADQQIEAVELQRCLTQSGIAGNYQMFSLETCRIMISMLDRDYSGKMGFNEFKELWNCLNQWRGSFYQYDADRSGTVEPHELHNAIRSWGYNLTPQALNIIVKRYSTDGRISFDNFIAIAVRLRLLTDSFRRRDSSQAGFAQFGYDDFIQMTMYC